MNKRSATATVAECWSTVPEWVQALAGAVDELGSQAKAARVIGYSPAAVNQVLQQKYRGDLDAIERAVRATLMHETTVCPVQGEIRITRCHETQRRPFSAATAASVKQFKACQACANNQT